MKLLYYVRKHIPIYINTFNIFKPLRTWLKNVDNAKFPSIEFTWKICSYKCLENHIYTWYWWDHPHIWNFKNKWILIIIDDVQYKYTFGLRELESVPFIIIRIFGLNMVWQFNAPDNESNYAYWEKMII